MHHIFFSPEYFICLFHFSFIFLICFRFINKTKKKSQSTFVSCVWLTNWFDWYYFLFFFVVVVPIEFYFVLCLLLFIQLLGVFFFVTNCRVSCVLYIRSIRIHTQRWSDTHYYLRMQQTRRLLTHWLRRQRQPMTTRQCVRLPFCLCICAFCIQPNWLMDMSNDNAHKNHLLIASSHY